MGLFHTRYGHFSDDGWEYVITTPKTPKPWVNVISNGRHGLIVSQTGGGFSWLVDCNQNRITRWVQDLVQDDWGKFFYIRDEETGDYWSPTYRPVGVEPDEFRCVHGVGYTTFESVRHGIRVRLSVFVPWDDNLEIWSVRLTNESEVSRRIGIYTYLEWCLGTGNDVHREFHKLFLETEFDRSRRAILARKRLWDIPSDNGHWNTRWPWIAYLACSEAPDGFETDKQRFIGDGECLSRPSAVREGKLSNTAGKWADSIGAFQKVIELHPSESHELHFYLGAASSLEELDIVLRSYGSRDAIVDAFERARQSWRHLLEKFWIETRDPATDVLANIWLKYQAISGRLWGRAGYFQQSGAYGFRDQLQDSQVFLYLDPSKTLEQIRLHAAHQFPDGHVLHWWHPLTEVGHDVPVSDNLLWLPFVVVRYVKETGDFDALGESIPFFRSQERATLLDHCLRAIDLALNRFSPRGLPLILACDWNDGLSAVGLEGKGESIWLAHFLVYLLKEFAELLERVGETARAEGYRQRADQLKRAVNDYGWDGEWFLRATKDSGEPIGSSRNLEGRIYLNPQSWAVIAGTCDVDRQLKAFQSALAHLECEAGPRLLAPAYTSPDPQIGYLTRYAPGVRENGGVYVHAATWAIWAACELGMVEVAHRLYSKIHPIRNGLAPERYQVEPYVTAGHIHGADSPHCGRGGWTWYTGSAAWLLNIIAECLIGVRADYEGLRVKPCYPPEWGEVKVRRRFRACEYEIRLRHNDDLAPGELRLVVDGALQPPGTFLIPIRQGKCSVEVLWRSSASKT